MTEPLLSPELMRRLDRLAVGWRRPAAGRMQGERPSPRRGRGTAFADFRPYVPGDDLRQVDWKAYARLERFFLKLFVEEEDTTVHLLVDTSASMAFGTPSKLDFARRVAAAVGYIALTRLEWLSVGLFAGTLEVPARPRRGRAAVSWLLGTLEGLATGGGTDLEGAMRRYVAAVRRPGPLLVLSDLYDPGWQPALRGALGARYEPTVIHILSPEELAPTLDGELQLVDVEDGERLELTVDAEARAQYDAARQRWQDESARWCRARRVPYVSVSSDFPLEPFVLDVLRRQGVVG